MMLLVIQFLFSTLVCILMKIMVIKLIFNHACCKAKIEKISERLRHTFTEPISIHMNYNIQISIVHRCLLKI